MHCFPAEVGPPALNFPTGQIVARPPPQLWPAGQVEHTLLPLSSIRLLSDAQGNVKPLSQTQPAWQALHVVLPPQL
jgi:hypothetical protein